MKKILSICAAMLMAFAVNATTTSVDAGEGTLRAAVLAAQSGDVLVLGDGDFVEAEQIVFDKNLTVQAAENAHPVVAVRWYSTIVSGAQVTFTGICFDGATKHFLNGETPVGAADHCFRSHDASLGTEKLIFDNCEFKGYPSYVIYAQRGDRRMDALTIRNCYFHDNVKSAIYVGYDASHTTNLACNAVTIENSTFANFTNVGTALIYIANAGSAAADQVVNVDHCTFYNYVKNTSGSYTFIDVRKSTDVQISNCIFAQPTAEMSGSTYCYGGTIMNCLSYNTTGHRSSGVTLTDNIEGDPLFADAANLDLHLGAGSPALGAGTDGSDLGDPRWYPAPAPVGDVYEIAGSFNSWTAVEMEEISTDLYMVEASVNAYYNTFKVIKNHDWNPGIGYSADKVNTELSDLEITGSGDEYNNFVFQLPFGIYKVKFYWDAANEKVYLNHDFDFEHNTFSVVGDAALDLSWELSTTDNMIYQGDSTYTLVKENVLVAPGNYGFKAVCNHSWDLNYGDPESSDPNHNAILTITAPGTYNITFSCRYGTPLVTAQAVMQTPFVIENGFYLIGKINGVEGWSVIDLTADRKLVVNPENDAELMKLNVELAENDLIKVVKVEDNAITTWYPANVDNYWVDIFHAGLTNVFFSEIPNNNENWYCGQLYVNLTPYRRHIEDWATICLPHGGALVNATAYNVTSCLEDHIIVEPIEGDIVKGKPYIIKPIDDTQDIVVNLTDGKTNTPDDSGVLKGNLDYTNPLIVAANANNYVLYDGELHLVVAGEEQSVKVLPYRAYLHIELTGAPSLRIVEAENGATNIENLGADENAVKFIQNGKLYIKRNNVIYTATGAVVK